LHELHGVIRSDLLLLACGFILYDFGVLVNLLNRGFVERDLLLSGAAAHRGTIAHRWRVQNEIKRRAPSVAFVLIVEVDGRCALSLDALGSRLGQDKVHPIGPLLDDRFLFVVLVEVVSVQIGEFNQRLGLAFRIVLNHVLLIINLEGALDVLRDEERVRVLLLAEEVVLNVLKVHLTWILFFINL
jgi:hypothetical protein